jgi:(p)ppGpp synthase/HD superfamily hydrolase
MSDDEVAIAILHDTVEDTDATVELLSALFNDTVAQGVWWLSDQATLADGNRRTRIEINIRHVAQAPANIKTIKLIDIDDNLRDIQVNDPNFAKVYFREKADALEVLRDGDSRMVAAVQKTIDDFFKR